MTKRYMSPLRAAEILGVGPKVVSEYLGTALKVAFYVESHGGRRKPAVIDVDDLETFRAWLIDHWASRPSRAADVRRLKGEVEPEVRRIDLRPRRDVLAKLFNK